MLRLKPSNTAVPDGFTYKFDDGHTVYAITRQDWREKVTKHAIDNNYPVPSDEEIENQLCRRLSGEWCSGGDEHSFINTRFTLDAFLRGTKVLASFVIDGAPVVLPEVAESRALICSRCPANVPVQGCGACAGVANAVAEAKGAQNTKYDHLLKVCGVCLCSNEAQVWIPSEYLAKGVTPDMMKTYEQIPECWKGRELRQGVDNQPA